MLRAISRYGARVLQSTTAIIDEQRRRGTFIQGPEIAEFEAAFARRLGVPSATTASYGRMAFYYILKALDLPAGSEIVLPALTFWVVPEMARQAGLTPVFADVSPTTFTMDPQSLERVINDRTRVVVPTHLYGLMCDMDPILAIAAKHKLMVIEDCAHALGATYHGRAAGTFGDAAFFSFQTLKPLNTYGGGMAIVRDPEVASRVAALAAAEPWPTEKRVSKKLLVGKGMRIFIRPRVFTISAFPILWFAALLKKKPDVYLWEAIRPLSPLPDDYPERYSNVQAALGIAGLREFDAWTDTTRRHAARVTQALGDIPGLRVPQEPAGYRHVYYQYCVYPRDRDDLVYKLVRRGLDVDTLHVDVCTSLELFQGARGEGGGADQAGATVQVPVYSTLTDAEVDTVIRRVTRAAAEQTRTS